MQIILPFTLTKVEHTLSIFQMYWKYISKVYFKYTSSILQAQYCRKDLQTHEPKELEPSYIQINQKNKKLIVGCVYKHPLTKVEHTLSILHMYWKYYK